MCSHDSRRSKVRSFTTIGRVLLKQIAHYSTVKLKKTEKDLFLPLVAYWVYVVGLKFNRLIGT